ncbi:CHAP domain-containing protein [Nonomuraea sp. NPDC050786]|uniref:CHAP domain-containing protein n=1 Tax=Nonomuraea sp. NPDC050786 TaxID=3154840 RepID=UPI0033E75565
MTPEIHKFIELLESQIGYSEKADDYTKFGDWYGKNVEFDADYSSAPWCDMYLSWAAHKLGYQDWIGQFAWTVSHAKWFKKQGAWGHKPKPGAIVFYDWSGSNDIDKIDHVGIVTRVEGNTIFTIEGNIDGGVAKRKERDTSKVVGYGYPERVKARLDEEAARQAREAQKKAEEQAALKQGPGTDVGALQLPGNEALTSLIPQNQIIMQDPMEEPGKAPVTGSAPAKKSPQTAPTAAPAPKVTTGTVTDSTAAEAPQQQPKKAKHAKPTTADTTAATAEPLPTHADASVTGPLPSISSPTLVGTTLVAALALLAVAKTRRLRTAPVAAGSTAPRSNTNRRRRRRTSTTTTTPVRASLALDSTQDTPQPTAALDAITLDTAQLTTAAAAAAVESAATSSAFTAIASSALRRSTDIDAAAQAARHGAGLDAAAHAARHSTGLDAAGQDVRHGADSDAFRRLTVSGTRGSDGSEAFGRTAATRGARHRRRPLDTRPFDLATDAAPRDITATGPIEIVLDTGPLERFVDTGPFERIVIPGATSAFDAFAPTGAMGGDTFATAGGTGGNAFTPAGGTGGNAFDAPDIGATYRGRRRRREHPVEDGAAFATDQPLRGRRHRRPSPAPQGVHVGGAQEHPLSGRRHATTPLPPRRDDDRELVGAGTSTRTSIGTSAGTGADSQAATSAAAQPARSAPGHAARSTPSQPRRRGRHRA